MSLSTRFFFNEFREILHDVVLKSDSEWFSLWLQEVWSSLRWLQIVLKQLASPIGIVPEEPRKLSLHLRQCTGSPAKSGSLTGWGRGPCSRCQSPRSASSLRWRPVDFRGSSWPQPRRHPASRIRRAESWRDGRLRWQVKVDCSGSSVIGYPRSGVWRPRLSGSAPFSAR